MLGGRAFVFAPLNLAPQILGCVSLKCLSCNTVEESRVLTTMNIPRDREATWECKAFLDKGKARLGEGGVSGFRRDHKRLAGW